MTADRWRLRSCCLLVILVSGSSYGYGGRNADFLRGDAALSSDLGAEGAVDSYVEYADDVSNDGPLGPLYDLLIQFKLFKFCKLLRAAQLEDVLINSGAFTIYAPTDSSFIFLPGGTLGEIEKNPQLLRDFILYHIIPENLNFGDIQDEMVVGSLHGAPLRFNIYGANEVVTVSGAQLLTMDLQFPLGFVNIIDRPLYPIPQYDIVGYLQTNHKEFYRLLLSAGLLELLAGGTYTVIVPDDAAFSFLSKDLMDSLATNTTLAERVLLSHVLPGSMYTSGVTNNMRLNSVGNAALTFTVRRGLTFVNGIPIVQSDTPVTNGVVHVINRVLLPDGVENDCNCKPSSERSQGTLSQRPGTIPTSPSRPGSFPGTGFSQRPGTIPTSPSRPGSVPGTGFSQRPGSQQQGTGQLGRPAAHQQTGQPQNPLGVGQVGRPGTIPQELQPTRQGSPQTIPARTTHRQGITHGGVGQIGRPVIPQQTGQPQGPQTPYRGGQTQRPTGSLGQTPGSQQSIPSPFSPNVQETPTGGRPSQETFGSPVADVAGEIGDGISHQPQVPETPGVLVQPPRPGIGQQGRPQTSVGTGHSPGSSFGTGYPQRPQSPFGGTHSQRPTSHVTKGQAQRPGNVPWTGQRQNPLSPASVGQPQGTRRQTQRPGIAAEISQEQTRQPGEPTDEQIQGCRFNAQSQQSNCQSGTHPGNDQNTGTGTTRQPLSTSRTKSKQAQRVPLPPPPTRAPPPSRSQTPRYPGRPTSHTPSEQDINQLDKSPVTPQRGGAYRPISSPQSPVPGTNTRPEIQTQTTRDRQPSGQRLPPPVRTTPSRPSIQQDTYGGSRTPGYPRASPTRRGQVTPAYSRHTPIQPQIPVTELPDQVLTTENPHLGSIPDQRVKTRKQPATQRPQRPPIPQRPPSSLPRPQSIPPPPSGRVTTSPPYIPQRHQRPSSTPSRTTSRPPPIPQRPPIQQKPNRGDSITPISVPGNQPISEDFSCRQPGDRLSASNRNLPLCPTRDINQEPCQRLDEPYDSTDPRPVCPGNGAPSQCRNPSEPQIPGDRRPLCPGPDIQPSCREPGQPPDGRPLCPDLGTVGDCRYPEEPENPSYPLPLCQDAFVLQGCRKSDEPYTPQDRRPDCPPDDCREPQEPLRPGDRRPLCSVNPEDTTRQQIAPTSTQSPHRKQPRPGATVTHSPVASIKPGKQPQGQNPQRGAPALGQPNQPSWQRPYSPPSPNQQSHTTASPSRKQPPPPSWQRPYTPSSSSQPSRPGSPTAGVGAPNQPSTAEDNEALVSPQQRPFASPPQAGGRPVSPAAGRPGLSPSPPRGGSSPIRPQFPAPQRPSSPHGRNPQVGQTSPVTSPPSDAGTDEGPRTLLQIVQNPGLRIKGHPVSLNVVLDLFHKAGLDDILSGPGPSTVFLPSDDAFLKLPKGVIEQLEENPELLRQVLLYHVTPTEVLPTGQSASFSIVTSHGMPIVVSILNGGRLILIGGAKAVAVTRATNGIFYVINELLYPLPQADIVTALRSRPDLKQITSLILQSGLQDMLTGTNPFTLFAPTDAAFAALPDADLQALTQNSSAVQEVLLGHVTEGAHFGREFLAGGVIPNARGGKLRFRVLSYGYTVNDVNIKTPEIITGTGVIHLIDSLILEPQDLQLFQQGAQGTPEVIGNAESSEYPEVAQLARGMGLNKFASWITNTGLSDKVHDGGSYTVFAPTDEAIESLPPNLLQAIDTDPDQVRPLLKYHIISQHLDLNTLRNEETVSTLLQDKKIRFNSYQNGQVLTASGVPISTAQGSGSVQIILVQQVLYPPTGNVLQSLDASPILQQLSTAIRKAHLTWTLTGSGPITIFAPSDAAFDALSPEDKKNLIDDRQAFTDLLKRHIIRKSVFTSGIQDGTEFRNDKGEKVTFSLHSGGVSINSIPVSYADVTATNGVLHVIDHFL